MSRKKIRSLKKTIHIGMQEGLGPLRNESKNCALALLARSIEFGHSRLAMIRLCTAVELDALVPTEHWLYCSRVAKKSADEKLRKLYLQAITKVTSHGHAEPTSATSDPAGYGTR